MKKFTHNQIVVVCFGTPTVVGDSIGPRVGTLLQEYNLPCFVYGTMHRPITARNMHEYMDYISQTHKQSTVLSVDASLGKKERVGSFALKKDGVCPAGIKGEKRRFGDVGILCVTAENTAQPIKELLSVSADYVSKMANKVAIMIKTTIETILI